VYGYTLDNGNYGCTSEISLCKDDLQNSKQITLLAKPWKVRCRLLWKEQHSIYCRKLQ